MPYQNVYDHKPNAASTFGAHYRLFTRTGTGTAPPAPRGVHETMCGVRVETRFSLAGFLGQRVRWIGNHTAR